MVKQKQEEHNTHQFLKDLNSTLDEIIIFLREHTDDKVHDFIKVVLNEYYSIKSILIKTLQVKKKVLIFLEKVEYTKDFYRDVRSFVFSDLSLLMDMVRSFFNKLVTSSEKQVFKKDKWEEINPITLFSASYFLLDLNYRRLKNNMNKYFNIGFREHTELRVINDDNVLWNTDSMNYKEYKSDIGQIKEYAQDVLNHCNIDETDDRILELQISEFIKNAIRHGNQLDINKKVKIWFNINNDFAKIIVEDEGEGFQELGKWNDFNKKRIKCIDEKDIMNALHYASYKTERSVENDGGIFLFSALEYWDSGLIFNSKKNKIFVMKYFY